MATQTPIPVEHDPVADRAVGYLVGAAVSALVHLGDRLGLYRAMQDAGPVTSTQLAEVAGLDERWVREWLHGQAGTGLVTHLGGQRFELTAEQAALLADEDDPDFLVGGFGLFFSLFAHVDRIEEAFRTGRGVPYNELGADHARNESRFSAPGCAPTWSRSSSRRWTA